MNKVPLSRVLHIPGAGDGVPSTAAPSFSHSREFVPENPFRQSLAFFFQFGWSSGPYAESALLLNSHREVSSLSL